MAKRAPFDGQPVASGPAAEKNLALNFSYNTNYCGAPFPANRTISQSNAQDLRRRHDRLTAGWPCTDQVTAAFHPALMDD
jgi:hypothetical protein